MLARFGMRRRGGGGVERDMVRVSNPVFGSVTTVGVLLAFVLSSTTVRITLVDGSLVTPYTADLAGARCSTV